MYVVQILVLIGLYFLKCTKFDQLILRKIIKIVAARCQILTLKCTKIDFGWGSTPDPAGGAYSAPPDPQLDLRGPTSKGRGREGREGERRSTCLPPRFDNPGYGARKGGGKGGRRKGREGERDLAPPEKKFVAPPLPNRPTRWYNTE